MTWWQSMNSLRGRFWGRAVLTLCAVVLAVGSLTDGGHQVYGWLWAALAVANGATAVGHWRALRAGRAEQDEVRTTGP